MRQPISSTRYQPALNQLAVIRSHSLKRASSKRISSNCVFIIFTCENKASSSETCSATWLLKFADERDRARYCSLLIRVLPGMPSTSFLLISFGGLIDCCEFWKLFFIGCILLWFSTAFNILPQRFF